MCREGNAEACLIRRQKLILLTEYSLKRIIRSVAWEVEFTDEFSRWWGSLTETRQENVAYSVGLLTELGPALGFPHSSKIMGSRHSGMRELRTQSSGRPLRTLYAFDPLRVAILLVGGDKTGDDRWYETFVSLADRIYYEYP